MGPYEPFNPSSPLGYPGRTSPEYTELNFTSKLPAYTLAFDSDGLRQALTHFENGSDPPASPRRFCGRHSNRRRIRRRGALAAFHSLPLQVDLIYEVCRVSAHHFSHYISKFKTFSRLEPINVLILARTSKDLRAILMSRASVSV